ncbi:MAG: hypothetical protein U9R73_00735 [Pseudomonadota bacterium]|nr:hypothetical protein [Pseudomonadota bacterium]
MQGKGHIAELRATLGDDERPGKTVPLSIQPAAGRVHINAAICAAHIGKFLGPRVGHLNPEFAGQIVEVNPTTAMLATSWGGRKFRVTVQEIGQ